MNVKNYAMIADGKTLVENTIVADNNYAMPGYYFVELKDGIRCETGMFYNKDDGIYYDSPDFKLNPVK